VPSVDYTQRALPARKASGRKSIDWTFALADDRHSPTTEVQDCRWLNAAGTAVDEDVDALADAIDDLVGLG
jgi:hypothetical protein